MPCTSHYENRCLLLSTQGQVPLTFSLCSELCSCSISLFALTTRTLEIIFVFEHTNSITWWLENHLLLSFHDFVFVTVSSKHVCPFLYVALNLSWR